MKEFSGSLFKRQEDNEAAKEFVLPPKEKYKGYDKEKRKAYQLEWQRKNRAFLREIKEFVDKDEKGVV